MSETTSGISRRTFIDLAAGAAGATLAGGTAKAQAARTGPMGANERVRIALIGCNYRGPEVADAWTNGAAVPEINYVAACDVYESRLAKNVKMLSDNQNGFNVASVKEYKRLLDNKDIDAIHIATPDHWHIQMLQDSLSAGKDVYIEKPLSNTVERAAEGLRAYRKSGSGRIVQFGTQQRSGAHFQACAKMIQDGLIGKVTNIVCAFPGNGYGTPPEPEVPVPAGLDWDAFQGPAPRHPFKQGRLRWRGWWDYGGGLMTDWGVHLTQIALWYMNAETTPPELSTGVGQYVNFVNPDHDQSPDSTFNTWKYPEFTMSFQNVAAPDFMFGRQGNWFFGPKGVLHVHRQGYELRPPTANPRGPEPADWVKYKVVPYSEPGKFDTYTWTVAHGRNFVKSVKDRNKPIIDLEQGFYASLPCLLGVKSVRENKAFKWDNTKLAAVPA